MNDLITENQKTALFISPHLDDVVFSCGGMLAKMRIEGWRTILCTVFTKSVVNPKGFALACQLDKNLAPDVDYMKLRRAEDFRAARILNVSEVLHLNFAEAPHRGYESAPELFAGVKPSDKIHTAIAETFALLDEIHQPQAIFAPQGLGNHCDHLQTIDAALATFDSTKIGWYFDTPYVIRQPEAANYHRLSPKLTRSQIDITAEISAKISACAEYKSQIDFQFGGAERLDRSLRHFHAFSPADGEIYYAENFLAEKLFCNQKIKKRQN